MMKRIDVEAKMTSLQGGPLDKELKKLIDDHFGLYFEQARDVRTLLLQIVSDYTFMEELAVVNKEQRYKEMLTTVGVGVRLSRLISFLDKIESYYTNKMITD